jgi:hypothetical protein
MNKRFAQLKNQDLLDKLIELANRLSISRKTDPNFIKVRTRLEAIQVEIQKRQKLPGENAAR